MNAETTGGFEQMMAKDFEAVFFKSAEELRAWFAEHHATATEIFIGIYKKGVDAEGVTYLEAVDQALCFGWIDSTLRRIDDRSHAQRFSPRKKKTYWSAVNVAKAEALIAAGLMHESGLKVFDERDLTEKPKYSFEQPTDPKLESEMIETFKANPIAWAFFERQSTSYKKRLSWWVISAKKQETRSRRLESLIAASAEGKQLT
jgi:uncharacterized protein YdeI (YjbR/CyaY-like superfamily)